MGNRLVYLIDKFCELLERSERSRIDRFLAESADLMELERRQAHVIRNGL